MIQNSDIQNHITDLSELLDHWYWDECDDTCDNESCQIWKVSGRPHECGTKPGKEYTDGLQFALELARKCRGRIQIH